MTRARHVRRGSLDEVPAASTRLFASAKKAHFLAESESRVSKPRHHEPRSRFGNPQWQTVSNRGIPVRDAVFLGNRSFARIRIQSRLHRRSIPGSTRSTDPNTTIGEKAFAIDDRIGESRTRDFAREPISRDDGSGLVVPLPRTDSNSSAGRTVDVRSFNVGGGQYEYK